MEELAKLIKTLVKSNAETAEEMRSLMKVVAEQGQQKVVGQSYVPPESTGPIEQCRALEALSNMIEPFAYCEESGLTFEAWYNRFRGVIAVGAANFDEKAKVELILMKLETGANALYRQLIAPADPSSISFDDTISKLSDLFKKKTSLLRTRWDCLNLQRRSGEDLAAYGARVNQATVDFKLKDLSEEQFKILIFILGLQDNTEKSIRTHLLNMQDKADAKGVTLQSMIVEAERIMQIQRDCSIGGLGDSVHLVQAPQRQKFTRSHRNSPKKTPSAPTNIPRTPCWQCGALHFVKDCPFGSHNCSRCHRVGHKEGYCAALGNNRKKGGSSHHVKIVQLAVNQSSDRQHQKRLYVDVLLNNVKITLQLDTGSDITILSQETWQAIGSPPLSSTSCRPVDCQGNAIKVHGEVLLAPLLNGRTITERCIVADCSGDLFGLEWINKFGLGTLPMRSFCNQISLGKQQPLDPVKFVHYLQENFAAVFSKTLGKCGQFEATLRLKENARPVFRQKRPVPYHTMALVSEELERLEQSGIISPVDFSLFAAPIVVVKKANGSVRICGDYSTGLNDVLEPHEYPIPTPEQIFASLANAKLFTQLDLSDAYLQIGVDEESKKLLTIHTHKGLFNFNRLCPGVKPAAGIFQQTMETILAGIEGLIIYFDDILIASPSMATHQPSVIAVLERLKQFNLRLRFEKCHFIQQEVRYLGVIVDSRGQRPDPAKVEAIISMPPPENLSQARSFLGAVGFYGRFIPSMSTLRAPIDRLMRKDVPFDWDRSCQEAFEKFKEILLSDLLLTHYDPSLPIMIAADASSTGIGCVAYHTYGDQSMKAFYHTSRRLTPAEQKYSQIEKEGLGIVFGVKKFHKYLWGRRFTIFTDHRPLLTIFSNSKGVPMHTANRLQRWAIILMGYDFDIKFIGTDDFGHADVLSRLIAEQPRSHEDFVIAQLMAEEETHIIANDFKKFASISFDDIRAATAADDTLQRIVDFIVNGWPPKSRIHSRDVLHFYNLKGELQVTHDVILYRDRTVVPGCFRQRVLAVLHEAHPGVCRMKRLARCYVFWPGIDADIESLVGSCLPCQHAQKAPTRVPLSSWPTPTRPWYRAHADFAGPINGKWYLVVVDAYSKWPEIFTMTTTTAVATISAFQEMTARHGCMEKLVTDNGPQWSSVPFKEFCRKEAIEHLTTAPYMPMSNGQAERFVDTFKRTTSKYQRLDQEAVQRFLRAYRSTPNERAPYGLSPAELIYGRRIRLPIAALLPPPPPAPAEVDDKMEEDYNRKHGATQRHFKEGDGVIYKNANTKWRQGRVIEQVGKVMYTVLVEGRVIRAHANQIRAVPEPQTEVYLFDDPVGPPAEQPTEATPIKKRNWRAVERDSPVQLRPRRK